MADILQFPFPEDRRASSVERTRRLMAVRGDLRAHMALNLYIRGGGSRAEWQAMTDTARAEWQDRAMAECERYWTGMETFRG